MYQFSHKDLWKEYNFTELFPGHEGGVRDYISFVGEKLDLRKDISFNTTATEAAWDEASKTWTVTDSEGNTQRAKNVIVATGFGAKRSTPPTCPAWTPSPARSTTPPAGRRRAWT